MTNQIYKAQAFEIAKMATHINKLKKLVGQYHSAMRYMLEVGTWPTDPAWLEEQMRELGVEMEPDSVRRMTKKDVVIIGDCVYINENVLRKFAKRLLKKNYVLTPGITMYMFDKIIEKAHEQNKEEEVAE